MEWYTIKSGQIETEEFPDDNKYELLLSIKVFMIIFRARRKKETNRALDVTSMIAFIQG